MRPETVSSPLSQGFLLFLVYRVPKIKKKDPSFLEDRAGHGQWSPTAVTLLCVLTLSTTGPQPRQHFGVAWQIGTLPGESDLQPSLCSPTLI